MKRLASILALICCFFSGFSQLDTEHFLPPLTSSTHKFIGAAGAGYQVIYLSTPSITPVNYSIYNGAGTLLYSGTVSNANPVSHGGEGAGQMHGLATPLMVNQANLNKVLTGRGIRVVADSPIYCNFRVRSPNNAQAASITAKGKNALGTEFRLGHIPTPQKASNWGLQSLGSKLATVGFYATEDNTTITVDLSKVNPKLWGPSAPNAGAPFTINLNKGQSYVLALRNQDAPNRNAGAGFTGGLVTSNKPIAVNTGSMGGYASNTWQADYGADQIVPYDKVGTKYAVVRGASNDNNLEKVMIVAHKNGTQVKVNGQVVKTLKAGEYYQVHGSNYKNGSMFIETSVPAYAYQFIMGSSGGEKKTPGMNFLPPISCETSSYVDNIPLVHKIGNLNFKGTVNIVTTKTGADLEVFVNGVKRNNIGTAKNVPNSDYVFYKISNLTGNLAVHSKTIALVSFTGYNNAAGFGGFFSGWKEEVISDSANCLPGYLFEPIQKPGTYRWFKDGIEIPGETNDSLFATETGIYTFERTNAGCKDTSDNIPAIAMNEFQLAGDTSFCPGDSVELRIVGQGFDSLAWQNGSKAQQLYVNYEGQTTVRIYSDVNKQCFVDTSFTTVELPSPTVQLFDSSFCDGGNVILDAGNPGMTYNWSTGASTQMISVNQGGQYIVRVIDGQSTCAGLDTATINVYSCNTDAQVTKTDNRDKYLPGTGTQYTIVAKNNGPADIEGATVLDPIPVGVNANDVTWSAVAHGGATTQSTGINTGALADSVDIPVGDSVVYTVRLTTPKTFLGDLTNIVTIKAERDTFPDNDVAVDTDTVDCSFAVSGTVNSKVGAWQQIGPVVNGLSYNIINGGGSKNFTPTDGPEKGNLISTVVYNTQHGRHISLTRDRYYPNDEWWQTISGLYDKTPHAWTGLSGSGNETAPILGFIAFIDQNGNGNFDSGAEEYIRDLSQLTITPTTSGELYMAFYDDGVYTDNAGVITIEASLAKPNNTSGPQDFKICKGDSVAFDAGNPSALKWEWSTGDSTQLIQAKTSGQYVVTVVTFGGCNTKDTMNLVVDSVDVILPPDTAFCEGGTVLVDAGAFDTWAWNTGDSIRNITIDSTGLYNVKVTNTFGCSDSDSISVTVYELPVVTLRNDTSICPGGSLALNAKNPGAAYTWNNAANSQQINIDAAGSYDVLVVDANNCEARDTMVLSVHPDPVLNLGEDTVLCAPQTLTIDAGQWSSVTWSTGESSQTIIVAQTSTIFANVVDSNTCTTNDTIEITINPTPMVNLQDDTLCIGDSAILNAGNPGFRYEWNTGESSQQIQINAAGEYHVRVYGGSCEDRDTMTLVANPLPVPDIGPDQRICEGETAIIREQQQFISYLWSTGSTVDSTSLTTAQVVSIEVVDQNGCRGVDTMDVLVNPLPVVDLGNDTTLCINETLTLDAGYPTFSHDWNTGDRFQTLTVAEGQYLVEVRDPIGCLGMDSITVYLDTIPDPYPKKIFEMCQGSEVTLEPALGFENFEIDWPLISSDRDITVNEQGTYFSAVSSDWCSDTFELSVISIDTPQVAIAPGQEGTTLCFETDDVELHVNANSVEPITNLIWDDGLADTIRTVTEPGVYGVLVENEFCVTQTSIEIQEFCPGKLFIPNAFTPDGDGLNDEFYTVNYNLTSYEMHIYDRWGLLVFTSSDENQRWDGTYKGRPAQQDVYVYKIKYSYFSAPDEEEKKTQTGTVTLVR